MTIPKLLLKLVVMIIISTAILAGMDVFLYGRTATELFWQNLALAAAANALLECWDFHKRKTQEKSEEV